MKKITAIIAFLLFAALQANAAYELVWSEEFNGSSLNTEVWNCQIGDGGWGNGESQYYTDRTDNVRVENGNLVITAKREDYYNGTQYTSARINTAGKVEVRYGKLEALIKLPKGQMGVWPAFWMMGTGAANWPFCGEIDIMEYMCTGDQNSWKQVLTTFHWNDTGMDAPSQVHSQYPQYQPLFLGEEPGNRYRIYGVEWTPDYMTGYIAEADGSNRKDIIRMDIGQFNDRGSGLYAFKYPAYFILNIAMGGSYVNYQVDPAFSSAQMLVDYIRVYQDRSAYPQSTATFPSSGSTPEPEPEPSIDVCNNPFSYYTGIRNSLNENGWWHDDTSWIRYEGTTVTATPPITYTSMYVMAQGNGNPLAANTEYRLSGSLTASQNCNVRVYIEAAGDNMQQLFNDHSIDLQAGVPRDFSVTATNGQVMYDPCVVVAADNNPANCTFTLDNVQCVATSCGGDVPQPDPEQPSEPGSASGSGTSISSSSGVQVQYNYRFSYADGKLTVNFDVVNKNDFAGLVSEMTDVTSGNVYTENATQGTITRDLEGYQSGQTVTVKMKWMYTGGDAFSQEHSYTIPVASAVEEVVDEQLTVSAYAGRIYCDEPFRVLNLIGQDVTADNGNLQGIYIVLVGGNAVKVFVD